MMLAARTAWTAAGLLVCISALAAATPVPAAPAAVPCTDAGECTDNEGTVWDLSMLGRVHRVGGTYNAGSGPRPDTFTYVFRLYANLAVVPATCTNAGIESASAMRYDPVQRFPGGPPPSCTQMGPDMTADPMYTVRRVPMGLTFDYQLAGGESLEVNLRCSEGAGVGACALFAPFYAKNDQHTKTGSGQTKGNFDFKTRHFSQGYQPMRFGAPRGSTPSAG
jgi:hypothetical protein